MRRRLAMVWLLVGLVGCGESRSDVQTDSGVRDDAKQEDGGGVGGELSWYKSGTRIKMRVLNTPDGAKQWQGWRDTQRNEDCSFVPTSDGMTRCIPIADAARLNDGMGQIYADAACSVLVVNAYGCTKKYIVDDASFSCGSTDRTRGPIYSVGQMYTTAYRNNGTCTLISGTGIYYAVGTSVPLTDFQSATTAIE